MSASCDNSPQLPPSPCNCLTAPSIPALPPRSEIEALWNRINQVMQKCQLNAEVCGAQIAPHYIQFELRLGTGVFMDAVKNALPALDAEFAQEGAVRLLLPIPGRGRIGVEVPVATAQRTNAAALFNSSQWEEAPAAKAPLALGVGLSQQLLMPALADAPDMLFCAPSKAIYADALRLCVASLLFRHSPSQLQIYLDDRAGALTAFAKAPHINLIPQEEPALSYVANLLNQRRQTIAAAGCSSYQEYNQKVQPEERLPRIAVVLTALGKSLATAEEWEQLLTLTNNSAAGVHLLCACKYTQIKNWEQSGTKSNFQWCGYFKDAACGKANRLQGDGDLLLLHQDTSLRIHCATITSAECRAIANAWKCRPSRTTTVNMNTTNAPTAAVNNPPSKNNDDRQLMLFDDYGVTEENTDTTIAAVATPVAEEPPVEAATAQPPAEEPAAAQPVAEVVPAGAAPIALDALALIVNGGSATVEFLQEKLQVSAERALNLLDELSSHEYLTAGDGTAAPRQIIYQNLPDGLKPGTAQQETRKSLESLFEELRKKIQEHDPSSRTVVEYDKGVHAIGKKIVEEAAEVWMSAEHEAPHHTAEEISQLIYHLLVMMLRKNITLEDIYRNL